MNVILLGAPGSGKGTQAAKITEKYGLVHVSTGDIFRENIKNQTPLGVTAKSYIDKGHLCPDELTVAMVKDRLSRDDCKNGVLLDGFPRTLAQAAALEGFLRVDAVINLDVPNDLIVNRIVGRRSCPKCGGTFHTDFIGDAKTCPTCGAELVKRADDNEETVKERLSVYESQTKPLIDFYGERKVLFTVNGVGSVDEIFKNIEEVLR